MVDKARAQGVECAMFAWWKRKKTSSDLEDPGIEIPEGKTLVLFVCTANLSRSPMAEAMFRHEVQEWEEIVVASCGTKTVSGFAPTPEALTVLQTHGYDTEGLITHRIHPAIVERANYIFVMGDVHLKTIAQRYPEAVERTYLITDLSEDEHDRGLDVMDPHEKPLKAYLEVYDLLVDLIPRVADFVIEGPTRDWEQWYRFYRRSSSALGR